MIILGRGETTCKNYEENFNCQHRKCRGKLLRKTRGWRALYKKKCGSAVGRARVRKRFAIQKHKNGDDIVLCNRLATSWKRGCMRNWKMNLELMHCDDNTKLKNDTGGLQDCKIGVFYNSGVYTYLKNIWGYQKGKRYREKVCSSKISEIIHAIYQVFPQKCSFFL